MNANLDNGKLLVNIMEAASLLSVGRSTIYKLMNAGDLRVVKLGCSARITMDSIRALVGANDNAGAGA
jgi:excisionase family DNA binding protein